MKLKPWFVYIIENEKGFLYTGITTDISRRLNEHGQGKKGAKFFRTSRPKNLVFQKEFKNRSEASKFESNVKKMKRPDKLILIQSKVEKCYRPSVITS